MTPLRCELALGHHLARNPRRAPVPVVGARLSPGAPASRSYTLADPMSPTLADPLPPTLADPLSPMHADGMRPAAEAPALPADKPCPATKEADDAAEARRKRVREIVANRALDALQKGTEIAAKALAEEQGVTWDYVRQLMHNAEVTVFGLPGQAHGPFLQPDGRRLHTIHDVRLIRAGTPQAWREYGLHGHMCNAAYASAIMFKSSVGGGGCWGGLGVEGLRWGRAEWCAIGGGGVAGLPTQTLGGSAPGLITSPSPHRPPPLSTSPPLPRSTHPPGLPRPQVPACVIRCGRWGAVHTRPHFFRAGIRPARHAGVWPVHDHGVGGGGRARAPGAAPRVCGLHCHVGAHAVWPDGRRWDGALLLVGWRGGVRWGGGVPGGAPCRGGRVRALGVGRVGWSGRRTRHPLGRVGGRACAPLMAWPVLAVGRAYPSCPGRLAFAPPMARTVLPWHLHSSAAVRRRGMQWPRWRLRPPWTPTPNNAATTLFEGIVAAVEATDPDHVNAKYWKAREKRAAASAQRLANGQAAGQPIG